MDFKNPVHFSNENSQVWKNYYVSRSQSGNGLPGFRGYEFQKGGGFWGNLFSKVLPIVKYLGKKGAQTLLRVGADAVAGDNVVESLKKQGKVTAQDIAHDVADRATTYAQTGKGRKRQRRQKTKSGKKKSIKRRKQKIFF